MSNLKYSLQFVQIFCLDQEPIYIVQEIFCEVYAVYQYMTDFLTIHIVTELGPVQKMMTAIREQIVRKVYT